MAETPRSGPTGRTDCTDCTDCTGKFATLDWTHWYNHHRLLEPIAYLPPAEKEAYYFDQLHEPTIAT